MYLSSILLKLSKWIHSLNTPRGCSANAILDPFSPSNPLLQLPFELLNIMFSTYSLSFSQIPVPYCCLDC